MVEPNVAYTEEYKKYRDEYNAVFNPAYQDGDMDEVELPDKAHILRITEYTDRNMIVRPYWTTAAKTEVINKLGQTIAEFKSIYRTSLNSFIKHKNGRNYLLVSIDLYGYSILDLNDYRYIHYIPDSSFSKGEETFIWTKVLYCPDNNILAVEGCYWAGPGATEFYDFTEPMNLPLTRICTTNDMKDQFDTDEDAIPIQWNADGTIKLEIMINEKRFEKDINVMEYKK